MAEKTINKAGLTARLIEPTQEMLEAYQEKLLGFNEKAKSAAGLNRAVIVSAAEAGILKDIEIAAIGGMRPGLVKWLSLETLNFIKEQSEVPLA